MTVPGFGDMLPGVFQAGGGHGGHEDLILRLGMDEPMDDHRHPDDLPHRSGMKPDYRSCIVFQYKRLQSKPMFHAALVENGHAHQDRGQDNGQAGDENGVEKEHKDLLICRLSELLIEKLKSDNQQIFSCVSDSSAAVRTVDRRFSSSRR